MIQTITDTTKINYVVGACSQCPSGFYQQAEAHGLFACTNPQCHHIAAERDFTRYLDPGESLILVHAPAREVGERLARTPLVAWTDAPLPVRVIV